MLAGPYYGVNMVSKAQELSLEDIEDKAVVGARGMEEDP